MTLSNHMLVGASIAIAIKEPILALPLAFGSHFVLDVLPHFGYPASFDEVWQHGPMTAQAVFTIISTAILLVTPGLWNWQTTSAALVAISPDLHWISRYFYYDRRGRIAPTSRFEHFHSRIQWCERPWGFYVEVVFFVVGYYLLWKHLH